MGESTLDHSALLASVSDPHALRAAGNAAYQVGDDMRAKSLYSAALDASNRARAEWIKGAAGDAPAIRRIAKVVYELKDEVQKMQKLKAERAAAKATASHSKQLEQLEEQEKAYEAGYEAARAKLAAKGKLMPREVMELTRPIDNNPVVAAAKLRLLAEHARRFDERRCKRCSLASVQALPTAARRADGYISSWTRALTSPMLSNGTPPSGSGARARLHSKRISASCAPCSAPLWTREQRRESSPSLISPVETRHRRRLCPEP